MRVLDQGTLGNVGSEGRLSSDQAQEACKLWKRQVVALVNRESV